MRRLALSAALAAGFATGYGYNLVTTETIEIVPDVPPTAVAVSFTQVAAIRAAAIQAGSGPELDCYQAVVGGVLQTRCTDVARDGTADFQVDGRAVQVGKLWISENAVVNLPLSP